MRLPDEPEPLVIDRVATVEPEVSEMSRQHRRKSQRAQAKSTRRSGVIVASTPATAETQAYCESPLVLEVEAAPETIPAARETAPVAPPPAEPLPAEPEPVVTPPWETDAVPRHRALATQPTGLVARVNAWFARLIPQQQARPPAVSQDVLAEQMLALRTELALVQGRLDRMIAAVTRN